MVIGASAATIDAAAGATAVICCDRFLVSSCPLHLATLDYVRGLVPRLAAAVSREVILATQLTLRFTLMVRRRIGASASTADLVIGVWAHISAVSQASTLIAHFDVLPVEGASDEHGAVVDVPRYVVSFEQDDYVIRSAHALRVQDAGVAQRHEVTDNVRLGFALGNVLDQALGSVLRGGSIGVRLELPVSDAKLANGSIAYGSVLGRCAEHHDVLFNVDTDAIFFGRFFAYTGCVT